MKKYKREKLIVSIFAVIFVVIVVILGNFLVTYISSDLSFGQNCLLRIPFYGTLVFTSSLIGLLFRNDSKKDIVEDTFLNVSYTSLDAKDNKGRDLARRAKDSVKFGVDYYGIAKTHLNLNGEYIGDRYDLVNKTGAETGNYAVFNSVADYEINKTFSTYLKVNNIFDRYYQTIDGYATAERSAYVGLKAKF